MAPTHSNIWEKLGPEIALLKKVQAGFDEANLLLEEGHPEMAVVRAVSMFEVFMKKVFVEPYISNRLTEGSPELGRLVAKALIGDQRWRERMAPLLLSCWKIDVRVGHLGRLWGTLGEAWQARNQIVHSGVDAPNADRHVQVCREAARALLVARKGANGTS